MLAGVMGKTADLVAGVDRDDLGRPTPCPDWDVRALVEHMVGWVQVFEAAAAGATYDGDPAAYRLTDDAAERFRGSADSLVAGWRDGGTDRTVRLTSSELPASVVFEMTLMEYLTHGWDLATATGRPAPYTDEEAERTLAGATATLQPQYRGGAIGHPVEVPDDAPAVVRLAAFMGRDPGRGAQS